MSQKEKVFSRKQLLVIFKIAFLEAMALSLIIPTISSTGEVTPVNNCTISNTLCGPIQFEQTAIANSTANTNILNSTFLTPFHNDVIVVTSIALLGDTIVSMTDTASDTFTKNIETNSGSPPVFRYSIWTAFFSGVSSSADQVIIQYSNASINSQNMALITTYRNVAGIGNRAGTVNGTQQSSPLSFQITTSTSGSWIVGGIANGGVAGSQTCSQIAPTPGTGLVQRIFGCSIKESPGLAISGDLEDNSTSLRNNVVFTYSESWSIITGSVGAAIELIAIDKEPQSPNFNNFCTVSNGLCVTTQYKMNFNVTNSSPTENSVLVAGTAYCSGLTSFSIATSVTHNIYATANFAGNDRNVTGASILVQIYITTTAPSTVFGAGQCSASQTQIGETMLNWSTFVGTGASNSQSGTVSGVKSVVAGTYFSYVEITPYNFGTAGHLLWLASPGQSYNFQSIMILEMK